MGDEPRKVLQHKGEFTRCLGQCSFVHDWGSPRPPVSAPRGMPHAAEPAPRSPHPRSNDTWFMECVHICLYIYGNRYILNIYIYIYLLLLSLLLLLLLLLLSLLLLLLSSLYYIYIIVYIYMYYNYTHI